MKKAFLPLLALAFTVLCAFLVYRERDAVPAYVNVIEGIPAEVLNPPPEETVLININTAAAEELEDLHGIGPSIAERIVRYREHNGKFAVIEELMEVAGIGEKTFEGIKDRITV